MIHGNGRINCDFHSIFILKSIILYEFSFIMTLRKKKQYI